MNTSVDYQIFKSQYLGLRTKFRDTFARKAFAENVVFNNRTLNITDEKAFDEVHRKLDLIGSAADTST